MKLQYKITIGVIVALILVNSLYGIYQFYKVKTEEHQILNQKIRNMNYLISSTNAVAIHNFEDKIVEKNLEAFVKDKEIVQISIVDRSNSLKLNAISDSLLLNDNVLKEQFAVVYNAKEIAKVEVIYSLKFLNEKVRNSILNMIKLTFWLSIISTFVIYLISRFLLHPIEDIVQALKNVDKGDYDYSMRLNTNDEFKEIETYFNAMIETIKKDLKLREKNRKELEEKNKQLKLEIETRQSAESNLSKSEERYRLMADNATDIISQITPDGIYTYISTACELLLGYKSSELLNKNSYFYVHKSDFEKVRISHTSIIENSSNDTIAYRIRHKDGNYIWFETSYKLMQTADNKDVRITCVSREITLRKKYEEELKKAKQKAEESDLLKSAFLANMSHEIRTPMNGIVGFSDLLRKPTLSEEKRSMYVELINQSSNELLTIINDILDISKIEANQLNIIKSEFNVEMLLNDLNTFFKNDIEQKKKKHIDLIMNIDLSDARRNIYTDANRTKQVLTNLINNAVKFTKEGTIEVKCTYLNDQHKYLFAIKDSGIGIAADQVDNVFERFHQIDNSSTREFGGTGLGLPICKGIVSLLGGEIWVVSDTGKGAEFSFTIPGNVEQQAALINTEIPEVTSRKKKDFKGKTILIVEDDPASFFFLNEVLSDTKVKIIHAKDGKQAVDICQENNSIDLVLMDMQLPIINGYDATAKIKAFRKHLPIIAQTANAMVDDKEKCLSVGCVDYIAKPIKEPLLISLIDKYIL